MVMASLGFVIMTVNFRQVHYMTASLKMMLNGVSVKVNSQIPGRISK